MQSQRIRLVLIAFIAIVGFTFVMPTVRAAYAGTLDEGNLTIQVVIVDDLMPKPVPLTDFRITPDKPGTDPLIIRTDEKGQVTVKLAPGGYTLESVRPVTFKGHSYTWKKTFSIQPDKDLTLKLSDADASLGKATGARQVSDEAQIYTQYKTSVVTVENDRGHGSGFVVSTSGLLLTNQHVTNGTHWLAVRFDHGIRIPATLIVEDAASDVAVIQINPSAVKNLTPIPLADPSSGPVAVEGEKVLAIGSPLNQQVVLTTGIVSKVEKDVLISDVNINHGNSGGPLMNLAGEVIGITTFGDPATQGGPGISGIVSIAKAMPVLQRARSMPVAAMPDAHLLPDISSTPFPIEALDAAARKDLKPFTIKAPHNYVTTISTPLIVASQQQEYERVMAKASKHRTDKSKGDQHDPMSPHRFWERFAGNESSPVVVLQLTPVLRESSGSVLGGLLGDAVGVRTHHKMEFHSDFYDMQLYRDGELIEPVRRFRVPYSSLYEDDTVTAIDQAHFGLYMYDPAAFEPNAKITLKVRDSSNLKGWETLTLDAGIVKKIWADFAAYRAQVSSSPAK